MKPSPILSNLTDRDFLALTIYAEARNQPLDGQAAVGFVILNRLATGRWKSIKDVVLARYQFTCWNARLAGQRNYDALMLAADRSLRGMVALDIYLQQAYWIADGCLAGFLLNPIGQARHYLNPKVLPTLPDWVEGRRPSRIIGDHHFYSGVA